MKGLRQTDGGDEASESLGTSHPRDLLCQQVAEAAQLREGPQGVEAFLRAVAVDPPRSLKALARRLSWPLPVTAAVRRELEKRDILDRQEGLGLTPRGKRLCDEWAVGSTAGWRCPHCEGRGWQIPPELSAALLPKIGALCQARPEVDVKLDQALATPETNLRRALSLLSAVSLQGRRIVFLGDDDWSSASLALACRVLHSQGSPDVRIEVLDIDRRIVEALNLWAKEQQAPLEAREWDLRDASPLPRFAGVEAVFTDPPYTEAGLELFCRRARQLLPEDRGELFLCYPVRDPQRRYEMEAIWHRLGLTLLEFHPGWNEYEGNSLHAGQSALWHLRAVQPAEAPSDSTPTRSIYTFDARNSRVSKYVCRQCGHPHQVGPEALWETIGALKKAGCRQCGGQVFSRR